MLFRRLISNCSIASAVAASEKTLFPTALEKLKSEWPRLYAKLLIHTSPFTVTKHDRIMTHRIKDVRPGDRLILDRIREVGSPSYRLIGKPYLDPSVVRVEATVLEHGRGRKQHNLPHRQRKGRRPRKNIKPHMTVLCISDISIKN